MYNQQVCYGSNNPSRPAGTCVGDYGGPIMHGGDLMGPKCLIGVASFSSENCSDPKIPSLYTRVGYFNEWIQQALAELNSVYVD